MALAAMFTVGMGSAQADDALATIKERGTIRMVGVSFPPYIVAAADGSYSGIDYDIVKGFAESIGVRVEMVPGTWGNAIAGIQSGKWDVAPVFCWKPARTEVVTFLESHYQGGGVAAVLTDQGPFTLEELNSPDITFVFPAGTWKETHVAKYYPKAKTKKITSGSTAQVTLEILSGRGTATVLDAPIDITKVEAAYPGKFTFLPSKSERLKDTTCVGSLIVKRDAYRLAASFNDFIKKLKAEGRVDALYDIHIKPVLEGKI
ncbi:MAG: transporter substrate-binding domain-containing protein [Alphaproteobacteria bacterium]|nr:transporter substrate-binding domain-containing protein [Alphaproteobacteria bacterium]